MKQKNSRDECWVAFMNAKRVLCQIERRKVTQNHTNKNCLLFKLHLWYLSKWSKCFNCWAQKDFCFVHGPCQDNNFWTDAGKSLVTRDSEKSLCCLRQLLLLAISPFWSYFSSTKSCIENYLLSNNLHLKDK